MESTHVTLSPSPPPSLIPSFCLHSNPLYATSFLPHSCPYIFRLWLLPHSLTLSLFLTSFYHSLLIRHKYRRDFSHYWRNMLRSGHRILQTEIIQSQNRCAHTRMHLHLCILIHVFKYHLYTTLHPYPSPSPSCHFVKFAIFFPCKLLILALRAPSLITHLTFNLSMCLIVF